MRQNPILLHRDIKPANIVLTNSGEVKILDLGLAKIMDESYGITADDSMKGSPSYMPYEQFMDVKRVDVRADVYAVGATLYQLLCRTRPFAEYSFPQLVFAKQRDQYIRLKERKAELPQELIDIVEKAMAFKPENRYQSAAEMLEALLKIYSTLEK